MQDHDAVKIRDIFLSQTGKKINGTVDLVEVSLDWVIRKSEAIVYYTENGTNEKKKATFKL